MDTYQSNFNVIYNDIRVFEHFDFSQNTVLWLFCQCVIQSQIVPERRLTSLFFLNFVCWQEEDG